jgi:hypothetical protein
LTSSTRYFETSPKPALILFWLVFLLATLSWSNGVLAQNPSDGATSNSLATIENRTSIRMPADFNRVEFYLITVDVGNQVWDNFGHTALRMVDENSGTDIVFNWGLFDASVGSVRFAANFALGVMEYQLGVSPPNWEFGRYQAEQRTVWQDRLVLTTIQKQRLYQRLAWNLRQENLIYDYDYFFDNCTTRVRDYLDEALGGAIAERSRTLTANTFRDEVQSHYASLPLIAFSLDVLMNERIDRRMSQWEQMFLPAQLRNQLSRQGLLDNSQVLAQYTPPVPGINPYYVVALLLLPVLLLLLSVRRASIASFSSQPGFTLRASELSYRIMGLVGLVVVIFGGVYGTMMTFGWLFSAHLDTHANINLLLFWPTDLLGLVMTLKWLLTGAAPAVSRAKHQFVVFYMTLHIVSALVYVVMGLTGLSSQSIGSLMLYVVPVLILFALLVSLVGLRPVRSVRFNW